MNITKAVKLLKSRISISRISWNESRYLEIDEKERIKIFDVKTGKSKLYNPTIDDLYASDWKKFETKLSKPTGLKDALEKLINGECTQVFRLNWLKTRETCYVYAKKCELYFSWMSEDDVTRYASPLFSPENGISDHELYFEEDWVCSTEKLPKNIVILKS